MKRYSIEVEFKGFTTIVIDAISRGEAIEKAEDHFEENYTKLRDLSDCSEEYNVTDVGALKGGSDKDAEIEMLRARIAKLES